MDAQEFIEKNSFYPLHKTHLKTEKSFKFFEKGLVCYEETSKAFVVAGDPVCKNKTDIPKVLDQFVEWAKTQNKLVCGYYFSQYVADKSKSLVPYYAGVTLGSDLTKFKLAGGDSKEIRRSLNYGERRELSFVELNRSDYFELFFELKNLESKWFKNKSTFKKIKFLLSSIKLENKKVSDRHFVVKDKKNKIIAYISLDKFKEPKKQYSFYVYALIVVQLSYQVTANTARRPVSNMRNASSRQNTLISFTESPVHSLSTLCTPMGA